MHLNCHSQFSLRYGTLTTKQLIALSELERYDTIVLTDINNTSACLNFIRLAKERGLKPIVGIDFRNGVNQQFVGLAKNNQGFQCLNEHLSYYLHSKESIPHRAPKMEDVYVIYPFSSFNRQFIELGEHEFIGIRLEQLRHLPLSAWKNHVDRLVLLQPVTLHANRDFNIHRLLRAIDKNIILSKLSPDECCNQNDRMRSMSEIEKALKEYPAIFRNTQSIIANCQIDFTYKGEQKSGMVNQNKKYFTSSKAADSKKIRELCYQNLSYRYPKKEDREKNIPRLEKELRSIKEQGFEAYFLINWDMLRYAREQGFFYVGRGSGANSIVAYLLKITDVDPVHLDLYFERFINPYRENPPDFDIDFSWKDRDLITDYLFDKYGKQNQIALLATYNSFTQKSLIRELAKVFGLPKKEIDSLSIEGESKKTSDKYIRLIYKYAAYMHGIPNHLSIHAGGVLISEKPIHYFSATSMPPKGYPLVQFDMVHAEDAGLYKFDILSQRGLGKVKDSLQMVLQSGKEKNLDIHATERFYEDEKIKELLRTGNTMGCFYVESPAMRMLLKKLKADDYLGLVAASSIIRPGVAKSGMMREYILRSQDSDKEAWRKRTPKIMQDLMEETYGVMVYQEDVIKVAHHFAGLTLGEADVMRRGMSGKFRSRDEFDKVRQRFFDNCRKMNYEESLIQEVWRQTESFAGYAFSKGHSASYAVESYQSLYLKAHYPMEFILGVLNNGGGFYRTEMYLHEARKMGAEIEAPCINNGNYLFTLKGENTIYIGFHLVCDLESRTAERLVKERKQGGLYNSLIDFVNRCPISLEQLILLIRAGAFRFTQKTKQSLLWEAHQLLNKHQKEEETANLFQLQTKEFSLPRLDFFELEEAFEQLELFGFSLCSPFCLLKEKELPELMARDIIQYLGKTIRIAGYLVTIKNTSTSRGDKMQFGTFIDRDGDWIDTVHFPPIVKQYGFRGKGCYLIEGKVVEEFGYATIEVSRMHFLEYLERDKLELKTNSNREGVFNNQQKLNREASF